MSEPTGCCRAEVAGAAEPYCRNCDLLVGLDGFHVVDVDAGDGRLTVTVETTPAPAGCPGCGVVAHSHGRRVHTLVDTPAFGRPVQLLWRKRTWRCPEPFLSGGYLHRTEHPARPAAGATDHAGMLVGGRSAASRARLGRKVAKE